jgi:hypothetical protein
MDIECPTPRHAGIGLWEPPGALDAMIEGQFAAALAAVRAAWPALLKAALVVDGAYSVSWLTMGRLRKCWLNRDPMRAKAAFGSFSSRLRKRQTIPPATASQFRASLIPNGREGLGAELRA